MIKRMNKVTSLLVAAAAMVSVVPANAATKLAIKEGTIENAIAFDGGYVFDGYKNDEDDNAVYFNNGSKDSMLDDIEDVDALYKYGTKYVVAVDGNDQYMIDMSNGKVSDDDTAEDLAATIETKLNSYLRKTDRYENAGNTPVETVNKISKGFSDVWYEYSATTVATTTAAVYGYTNQSGKYIDASVTANMYVTVGTSRVKIDKFGDTEKVGTGSNQKSVTVNLTDAKPLTIADDSNYIYRIVEVEVSVTGENPYKAFYLQKISKAQGDKEKGAYVPKSVESYLIDAVNGIAYSDNKDVRKATDLLNVSVEDGEVTIDSSSIRVVDGSIYVVNWTNSDESEIKVTKLVLKRNEKIKVTENDKVDYSVVKYSDDVEEDADDYAFDVDGNVWTIYNGKISKSVKGGDFEVVYTCDRTLDRLDVYNEGNLIAWEHEGEVYTTVQEGKEAAKDEAEEIVKPEEVKTGWQSENGAWYLYDATGAKLTGWQNVGGTWYYMDPTTTAMRTGWLNDNGTWYYLQSSGAMKTGWLNDNGTWYYLNANGSMAANTTVDGYVLGANGAWIR